MTGDEGEMLCKRLEAEEEYRWVKMLVVFREKLEKELFKQL